MVTIAAVVTARAKAGPVAWGPSWFATVMGTGIVAVAATTLPAAVPGLDVLARAAWSVAATLLVLLVVATAVQQVDRPGVARAHLADPVMSHFFGAPAMALMTVAAGALLVGADLVGDAAALMTYALLWPVGTALGLWTTFSIPRRTRRRGAPYAGPAFGGWLMPVVAPMVSAATGPLVVPHLPVDLRVPMIGLCCVLFAVAVVASTPILVTIVRKVLRGRIGPATTVPTVFIVLGPLGQSATAAHTIADAAGPAYAPAGVAYGLAALALAAAWLTVAVATTARATRAGMPFGLTWWSFTFPVGTVVTGASAVAAETGSHALAVAAVVLFAALVTAWVVVAAGTVRGLLDRTLLPVQTA